MKQKVSLCSALIHDPDVLILDEPTTGVDPLSRGQFWDLIDDIRADRPGMRHPVSSCESLVVRDGGVMQLLVVEGAIVPGAPKDAYPGAGEDANGMGMIAASVASALVDVCCPGGCVSGVVGEAR